MDTVKIRGLKIDARHGVRESEKVNAQPFIFDIDIGCDFYGGFEKDDLGGTVNYSAVCERVAQITLESSFNLIETLAYTCAYAILDGFAAHCVTLTVWKPEAPVKREFESVGVTVTVKRTVAYLSLGSSMGDKKKYLDDGLELLSRTAGIKVKKVSSYIQTEPYGGVAKNGFLNCAAEIETYLTPQRLLKEIHRVENACGRVRKERWGDRTLDIDIIFFGGEIIRESDLIIPHPEYRKREFVLTPLKEIAPRFICPDSGIAVKDL